MCIRDRCGCVVSKRAMDAAAPTASIARLLTTHPHGRAATNRSFVRPATRPSTGHSGSNESSSAASPARRRRASRTSKTSLLSRTCFVARAFLASFVPFANACNCPSSTNAPLLARIRSSAASLSYSRPRARHATTPLFHESLRPVSAHDVHARWTRSRRRVERARARERGRSRRSLSRAVDVVRAHGTKTLVEEGRRRVSRARTTVR